MPWRLGDLAREMPEGLIDNELPPLCLTEPGRHLYLMNKMICFLNNSIQGVRYGK